MMTSTFGDKDVEYFRVLWQISSMLLCYLILVFSQPQLAFEALLFHKRQKICPTSQYCIAVKDRVQTRVFTGLSPFIHFYQMVYFRASISRQGSFRLDLVPQLTTRSGGGSDLHFSLRSLHILSKSLLLDLHPSTHPYPRGNGCGLGSNIPRLVHLSMSPRPYPSRLSSIINDIFRCMQSIWCSVVVKEENSCVGGLGFVPILGCNL